MQQLLQSLDLQVALVKLRAAACSAAVLTRGICLREMTVVSTGEIDISLQSLLL